METGLLDQTPAAQTHADIDILRIMELLPHRYPMLLVDRVTEIVLNESAVGIKNCTMNEPYFTGHFPAKPVMPGVLVVESMAQTACCLVALTLGKQAEGKLVFFTTIDEARFRRPIVPGDQIRIQVVKQRQKGPFWRFAGKAFVDGQLCAEAVFAAAIMDQ